MSYVPQTRPRGREYEAHNVPPSARAFPHIAAWFYGEADRPFAPKATGREIAAELSRNLRPSARRDLFKEEL